MGHAGMAAPLSGKASWRSSPSATALMPSVHMRRAAHLAQASCRTAAAFALGRTDTTRPQARPRFAIGLLLRCVSLAPLREECGEGGGPHQPHPGTRVRRCRCSLPGLTGFTTWRCEGTGADRHRPTMRGGDRRPRERRRGYHEFTRSVPARVVRFLLAPPRDRPPGAGPEISPLTFAAPAPDCRGDKPSSSE